MKRYEKYKPTGIQWLPEIPVHWNISKIKSHFRLRATKVSDKEYSALSVSKNGITPQLDSAVKTDNGDNRKLVKSGDFVVNSRSDRKGSCGISSLDGSVSLINIVLEPMDGFGQFYHHLFRSNNYIEEFYRNGRGIVSDLWTTRWNEMSSIEIPFPPIDEQKHIAAYLDKRITLIDNCKCQRERELRTLNELKQAEIASVVTRGFNPDVPMKDSGIPWIGMIPEHWNVKSLRAYLRLVSEKNHPKATLLSVTREQGVIVRDVESKEENHNFIPEDLSGYKYVHKGQFVINKMKAWQGSYGVSLYDGIVSPAYYVCDLDFPDKEYFSLAIRSKTYVDFFARWSKGIRVGQWDLEPIALKSVPFLEPPVKEMHEIVDYVKDKTKKIDTMIEALTAEIDHLTEYKQRLISDVVTGQIDVRGEQI